MQQNVKNASGGARAQGSVSVLTAPSASTDALSPLEENENERAYGTFEVSFIDVDEASARQPPRDRDEDLEEETTHASSSCGLCCDDCCLVVSFLWMPLRWRTYKIVLFHLANFVLAVGTTLWTLAFLLLQLCVPKLYQRATDSLHAMLRLETRVFNFVSPPAERVIVYGALPAPTEDSINAYCFYGNVFFGATKFICSAVPGLISAGLYLWSLQHVVVAVIAGFQGSTKDMSADEAAADSDVAILLSLLSVYGAAVLLQICAHVSRHVTIFFCAEYLLSASSSA